MRPKTFENFEKPLKSVFSTHPKVVFAYLFGSHADGTSSHTSDVDIAIYISTPSTFSFSHKLQIHGDICRALQRNDVDLVILNQTKNLLLIDQILRNGQLIFNRNQAVLDDFFLSKMHIAIGFKEQRQRVMGL